MAVTVEDVRVRVTVDGADGYDDLRDKQKDLEDQSKSTGSALEGLKTGLVNIAAAIQVAESAVTALAAAMATLKVPAQLAIDFEREFALVATLSDKVGKDLERGLLDLAARVPQTAGDITKATYQAISAGIDPDQVVAFLDAASKAAIAGNSTLTTSVEALTTAVNAFETQGVTAARASDVLFATVKAGVTTFDELNSSLGQASAVAAYGVSIEEVGAAIASLTKLGFSTADAITRINGAVKAIANPVGSAAAQFKRLGVEVGIDRLQAVGLAGVLEDVQKATGGSTSAIAKLTNRFEAQQGLLGLLGSNYSGFRENLDRTTEAAGSTSSAFDKLSNTTQGAIDAFQSTAEGVLREVGTVLLPSIVDGLESLGDTIAKEGPAIIASLKDIALTVGTITVAALKAAAALARVYNFATGGREEQAAAQRSRVRAESRQASALQLATGGADLGAILAGGGTSALQDFEAQRRAEIESETVRIRAEFNRTSRELAAARAAAAAVSQVEGSGAVGTPTRPGAARFEFGGPGEVSSVVGRDVLSATEAQARVARLEATARAQEDRLRAASQAEGVLLDAINKALDEADKTAAANAAGGGGADKPPRIPRRGRGAPDLGGATLLTPLQNAVGDAYGAALGGAGAYGDFAAELAAREQRNAELARIGAELAERELALVEDESTRRLAALSLRHEAELEAIGEFEEQRTQLLELQGRERAKLEDEVSKSRRESVARDVAATIGGLADISEALGATGKAQSAFRAVALTADALYHGIRGGGAQADAILAFASGNIPQGIALQAAAIQQFAAAAQAAAGAAKLASGGGGGGGGRSGGGSFSASRRDTDAQRSDRNPRAASSSQAPNLTIVISDAVPLSDRREVMEPLARSLGEHIRRGMTTRAGARWPGAA